MHAFYARYFYIYSAFFWSFFLLTLALTIINVFFIHSEFLTILIAVAIGSIYSIYLIIDTQLILGGRKSELTLDNYVLGAAMLYIDIIQLFLQILKILGSK
jgi:FtsH-binding integral membrane protein